MEDLKVNAVGRILERGAAQVPDKVAVVDGGQRKTYGELNSMADALAASLSEIGFQKGDRIAIYMKNSLELVVAFYALQKLGVIAVWVNAMYRRTETEYILNNSEAKAVFIFGQQDGYNYLEDILNIKSNSPTLKKVIIVGDGKDQGVYAFYDLIAAGRAKKFTPPEIDIRQDLAMLLYTSGTTGTPKGALITHRNVVRLLFNDSF